MLQNVDISTVNHVDCRTLVEVIRYQCELIIVLHYFSLNFNVFYM